MNSKHHWVRRTELDIEEQKRVRLRRTQRLARHVRPAFQSFWARVAQCFNRMIDGFTAFGKAVVEAIGRVLPEVEPYVRVLQHQQLAYGLGNLIEQRSAPLTPNIRFGCALPMLTTGEVLHGPTRVEWPDGSIEFVRQHSTQDSTDR